MEDKKEVKGEEKGNIGSHMKVVILVDDNKATATIEGNGGTKFLTLVVGEMSIIQKHLIDRIQRSSIESETNGVVDSGDRVHDDKY